MPHDVAVFASIAATLVATVAAIALIGAMTRAYRRRSALRDGRTGPLDAERLARMEQALEAVALEVERIGESQRYLTRLQVEGARPQNRSGGSPVPGALPDQRS